MPLTQVVGATLLRHPKRAHGRQLPGFIFLGNVSFQTDPVNKSSFPGDSQLVALQRYSSHLQHDAVRRGGRFVDPPHLSFPLWPFSHPLHLQCRNITPPQEIPCCNCSFQACESTRLFPRPCPCPQAGVGERGPLLDLAWSSPHLGLLLFLPSFFLHAHLALASAAMTSRGPELHSGLPETWDISPAPLHS